MDAPKVSLHRELETLPGCPGNVKLTSFIISTSTVTQAQKDHRGVTQEELEAEHILFLEDTSCMAKLLGGISVL